MFQFHSRFPGVIMEIQYYIFIVQLLVQTKRKFFSLSLPLSLSQKAKTPKKIC